MGTTLSGAFYASSSPFTPSFSPQIAFLDHRCRQKARLSRYASTPKPHYATAAASAAAASKSPWDDKPYDILASGERAYLDEQDVAAFLDASNRLVPLHPAAYNPAAYLRKKIDDIPEERRPRLLPLLNPRLISRLWNIAGTQYNDPKFWKPTAPDLLSSEDSAIMPLEFWTCRKSEGPMPVVWKNCFKKALFGCKGGKTYGRFICGPVIGQLAKSFSSLYFEVRQVKEVMATEEPCDLAYDFGDGLFDLHEYPPGFPKPAEHPWPFNDQVVLYVRRVGSGVLVGQAWQEGRALEQVPQKLCGEILMVKDYLAVGENC